MKFRQSLILLPALALTACGGNDNDAQTLIDPPGTSVNGSVVYSYPADGQSEVSTRADLVLRFSHAITDSDEALADKIRVMAGDQSVDFSITRIDEGRSLKLIPTGQLEPGTEYTVTFEGSLEAGTRAIPTPNAIGAEGIQFNTRGALKGSLQALNLADEFAVAGMIPAPDTAFLPVDFSTFRLQLTRPVHPDWQAMGGAIRLLDGEGEPVPATVLVKDRAITVDPCIADTPAGCGMDSDLLDYNQTYTLQIESLPGRSGGTLDYSASFTPEKSAPHVTLYQQIVDSGLNAGRSEEQAERSLLNGQIINGITLESVLQGNAGPSQQTADLFAQVAYAPDNDDEFGVPLRIARNSKLASSSLDIRINGLVPVINEASGDTQATGDIKVTMLSDASGYLLPNPYSNSASAPRHVRLWMDVAMNTEEAQPNAALSQDIMALELTGIAQVRDGLLTIDAIGIVEPRLLGMEDTKAAIAFRIEADTSADVQFDSVVNREADTTGPQLVSWMPGPADDPLGNREEMQRPGDPVILNFDEPLDRDSAREGITLTANGTTYSDADGNLNLSIDGTSVALNPAGGLEHGVEYTVGIGSAVTDMVGNGVAGQQLEFTLPDIEAGNPDLIAPASPIVLTSYPGFPCTTEELDLTATPPSHGYCIDKPSSDNNTDRPEGQPRDELPVTELPADRAITVVFSRSMHLDSITPETFIVESVPPAEAPNLAPGEGTPVPGRFVKENQRVMFIPEQAWNPGQLYRYTLVSEQGVSLVVDPNAADKEAAQQDIEDGLQEGSPGICSTAGSNPEFICGANGLALQTDVLVNTRDVGGPDLTIYFIGSEPRESVLNPLRNLPVRDTNSNFVVDCYQPNPEYENNPEEEPEYIQARGSTDCPLEPFAQELADPASDTTEYLPSENAAKLVSRSGVSFGRPEGTSGSFAEFRTRVGCPIATPEETDRDGNVIKERQDLPDCPASKFIYQTMGLNTEVLGRGVDPETGKPGVKVLLYPSLLMTTSIDVFIEIFFGLGDSVLTLDPESVTGPQVLRMRYAKDPECSEECPRNKPIPGIIVMDDRGNPVFKTEAELLLDAPNLASTSYEEPVPLTHNLYSYPFTLDLDGDVKFFDDGRMKIEQRNSSVPGEIVVDATIGLVNMDLLIPLQIPVDGIYLNFLSNPIKPTPTSE